MGLHISQRLSQFFSSKWQLVRVAHLLAILTILGETYMMETFFPNYWDSNELRYLTAASILLAFILSFWSQRDRFDWIFVLLYETVQLAVLSTLFFNEISIRFLVQVLVILVMIGGLIGPKWLLWAHYVATLLGVVAVMIGMDAPVKDKAMFLEVFGIIWAISLWGTFWVRRSREQLRRLIDEKSLANEQLARSNTMLETSQAIAGVGSWEVELPEMKLSWSPETYAIVEAEEGVLPDSQQGMALVNDADRALMAKAMKQAGSEGKPFDLQVELTTFKGNRKFVRVMGFGAKRNEHIDRIYGVVQDITQYRDNELQLLRAKEQAEKAQKAAESASIAKSQFLSVMSHEIRTPMNAVIGISHLLLQENPKPEQVDNLETLHFAAENLLSLINDILDFSKIEAGKVELETFPFSLPKMLQSIIQSSSYKAQEKGIYLRLETPDKMPTWIKGDPTRLTQILNNLVSNAVKFTEIGGVCVCVSLKEEEAQQAKLRFSVKDTGIGIPEDKIGEIFESFTQAKTDITRRYGGTGLGLAITRKLLELHQSKIEVESKLGQGTIFSFDLWVKFAEEVAPSDTLPELVDSGELEQASLRRAGRILLVEDNLINVKVASKFLVKWGYEVMVASNGREGVEMAQAESFDCILMDLQMPEVDGFQATTQIRTFNHEIPIIALTAEATGEIRQKVIAAGMNDYSTKPFTPRELKQKIAQYVSPEVAIK